MEDFIKCSYLPDGFTINKKGDIKSSKGKILKKQISNSGYYFCSLSYKNKQYGKFIHRALAFAFLPKKEGKNIVNHKDGDKKNNSLENLEWCTYSENNIHSMNMHGHKPPNNFKCKFGFDHNRSKAIICVETGDIFGSQMEVKRKIGVSSSTVSWAIKNKKPILGKYYVRLK